MRDISRVLFPEPTSFIDIEHWTKYEYVQLLNMSPALAKADEDALISTGRSMVADAFYALSRQTPNQDDILGVNWSRLMNESVFPQKPADWQQQVTLVLELAERVRKAVFEHAEEIAEAQAAAEAPPMIEGQPGEAADVEIIDISEMVQAQSDAEAKLALINAIKGGIDGSTPALRFQTALDMADRFDLDLFASLLGWAKSYVGGAARENKQGREELTGYRLDGWSDDVDTYDMIGVAEGDPVALVALAENALRTSQFRSMDPQGRGACVLLRDQSTSMLEMAFGGKTKHEIATTLEVVLSVIMGQQKRDLVSMLWSDKVSRYDAVNTICGIVAHVRTHTYGVPGLQDHLSTFLRGGTVVVPALEQAANVALDYADPCDVLLLSDMDFHSDPTSQANAVLEQYRSAGGRVWGIFVGPTAPDPDKVAWLDGWVHSTDLRANADMGDILAKMVRNAPNVSRKTLL